MTFNPAQDEYKVRNWFRMGLNGWRRLRKKDPRNDFEMQPPPDDDPYGVAAVCTVVYSVFSTLSFKLLASLVGLQSPRLLPFAVIDNGLQLISIFVICKGQKWERAR